MTVTETESRDHQGRIGDLLEKLKHKLRSFTVINLQAQVIGQIKDFFLDKSRRLYMVIASPEAQAESPFYLLSSKHIYKVDTTNQAIVVDLSLAGAENLPVYNPSTGEVIQRPRKSGTLLDNQVSVISGTSEMPDLDESRIPEDQFLAMEQQEERDNESSEDENTPQVVEEEIVRLLEERLVVNRSKRKIGEIVVRKEIETRIVEVPIQREKLIIEQVGSETRQLAEIDLGQGEVTGIDLAPAHSVDNLRREVPSSDSPYTVTGEFLSPKAASNLLEAIALQGQHGCRKVRVELVLDNPQLQQTYQQMFDRCSTR